CSLKIIKFEQKLNNFEKSDKSTKFFKKKKKRKFRKLD
ncbi:hypothetical protein LCGC14_2616440, partial [marine sediment metagenome]